MTVNQRLLSEGKLIKQLEGKRELMLSNMTLGLESIGFVRIMIKKDLIGRLKLNECAIGNQGLNKLLEGDVIKNSKSLVFLDLSCNGLTGKSISKLCEALIHNKSIIHVNLSSY